MGSERRLRLIWGLWLWWVLASGVGSWTGFVAADAILDLLGDYAYGALTEVVIFGFIGVGLGTMQWLVLRRHVARAGWWIGATALGGTAVGVVAGTLGDVVAVVGLVIGYGVMGAILGVLQWLVLRRQIDRAWWWLAVSPAGWALGTGVAGLMVRLGMDERMPVSEAMGLGILFGVMTGVAGVLTGGVLVSLLSGSRSALVGLDKREPA
jgi:hypothetical protein